MNLVLRFFLRLLPLLLGNCAIYSCLFLYTGYVQKDRLILTVSYLYVSLNLFHFCRIFADKLHREVCIFKPKLLNSYIRFIFMNVQLIIARNWIYVKGFLINTWTWPTVRTKCHICLWTIYNVFIKYGTQIFGNQY